MNRWESGIRALMKIARPLLLLLVGGLVLKSLVATLEPRLVFYPSKGEDATPAELGLAYERVTLATADGERIVAWQLEPRQPRADIAYFHGNGGNLSLWLPVFEALHRLDYRVLAVDYRGYGLSTGTPTEEGVYRDAEAVARHAAATRAADRPLVFWGRSLGTPIAAAATRVAMPDGLVLESGFPDKASVIRRQPLLRALNLFASYRFSTVELLQGFRNPVLVMHGDLDSIVPFSLGRELFERLTAPKQFLGIRGAGHNEFIEATRRDYWDPVVRFIEGLR